MVHKIKIFFFIKTKYSDYYHHIRIHKRKIPFQWIHTGEGLFQCSQCEIFCFTEWEGFNSYIYKLYHCGKAK